MLARRLFVLLLITGATFWYCGDDGDNGTGPSDTEEPPEFNIEFPTLPAKLQQSNNQYAQEVKLYLTAANNLSTSYLVYFDPPANAGVDGMEYTWTESGLTVHLNITESDDKIYWEARYSGSDGEHTYDNWLFLEAERNKDGTSMSFTVYDKDIEGPWATFEYHEDESGTKSYDFKAYGSNNMRLVAEIHSDSSGWVEQYDYVDNEFVKNTRYEWDAQGNGQWWDYEEGTNGTW